MRIVKRRSSAELGALVAVKHRLSEGIPLGSTWYMGQIADDNHGSVVAARATRKIDAGDSLQNTGINEIETPLVSCLKI